MMRQPQRSCSLAIIGLVLVVSASALGDVAQAAPPGPPLAHPSAALANPNSVPAGADQVPGEILVKFAERSSRATIERAKGRVGGRPIKSFPSIRAELWQLETGVPVGQAIAELARSEFRDAIAFAEPNWISTLHELPNDPLLPQLWGLHNIGQSGGTDDADIDAPEAWEVTTGSANVVIAVLDSGIDYLHEDLAANLWRNTAEVDGDGIDNDNNGFADDVMGWDFVNEDNDPLDDHGHGTHTSGTIGAFGDNGIGVSGVNWHVQIMPLKICSAAGYCTTDDQIDALLYAASFEDGSGNLVRITSNSYGGGRRSKTLQDAIEQSGALFVASAGNSGSSRKQYPAGYTLENIISVAATDHDDQLAAFSNYGASWVDLAAPGVDVLSTVPYDQYDMASGTSMSAPHVAGVAGLVLVRFPEFTNAEIKAQILATVDPLDSLVDRVLTGGRLNAATAVGAPGEPPDTTPPGAVADLTPSASTHDTVTLTWTAPGDDGDTGTAYLYDLRYALSEISSDLLFDAAIPADGEPAPQAAALPETFTVTGLSPETTYFFALKTTDEAGNVSGLSNSPEATTTTAPFDSWTFSTVAAGSGLGHYLGLDFDGAGVPAVAYSDYPNSDILFSHWNGSGWDPPEIVDSKQYAGVDLAYDGSGQPTITYGWGKLWASEQVGGAWVRTTITPGSNNDVTSVRLDPSGILGVAYRARKGLGFAQRIAGIWSTETVDPGAAARYVALAYDQSGWPAIAYSDDPDGDGWLSALKLARFDGSSWQIETVAEGPVGYGVPSAIAFEPYSDVPTLMHGSTRLLEWVGGEWVETILDPNGGSGSIAFAADGTLYAAWEADSQIKMATRDPYTADWVTEVVDAGPASAFHLPLKIKPDASEVYVVYEGEDEVRVAWRSIAP